MPQLIIPSLKGLYTHLDPVAYTLLRILAGGFMMQFGFQKLFVTDVSSDIAHMQAMGLEPAVLWAYFVVTVEFVAGLGVVLGLLTRPFAIMLVVLVTVMLVAVLIPRGSGYQLGGLWLASYGLIAARGGGVYSLDRLIGREF